MFVPCLASPVEMFDRDDGRANIARRLRAPLFGRALLSISSDFDAFDTDDHPAESHSQSDEDRVALMNKRRPNVPLFGRRGSVVKRRGPLFG